MLATELVHPGRAYLKASPTGNTRQRMSNVTPGKATGADLCSCNLAPDSGMAWNPRWVGYAASSASFCLVWNRLEHMFPVKQSYCTLHHFADRLKIRDLAILSLGCSTSNAILQPFYAG